MDEHGLGWDDLRLVLAVGRAGSLTGAAAALGISHPTVFRHVNRIEARLGVRLFDRARDGYGLTPAGEEVVALAARMATEVTALERRLAGQDLRPSGTVRLTTTDTLMLGPLPPLLDELRRRQPDIVVEAGTTNSFLSLSRREADIALRPAAAPPAPLAGRRLCPIATAVYAPADAGPVDPADLAARDWVLPDDSLSGLPAAIWAAERRLDGRAAFRANSLMALRAAAAEGMGLAILPCYVGDAEPRLARVGAPLPELASELWLLVHPDLRRVARIRAVLDGLAALLAPLRPLFAGIMPRPARAPGARRR